MCKLHGHISAFGWVTTTSTTIDVVHSAYCIPYMDAFCSVPHLNGNCTWTVCVCVCVTDYRVNAAYTLTKIAYVMRLNQDDVNGVAQTLYIGVCEQIEQTLSQLQHINGTHSGVKSHSHTRSLTHLSLYSFRAHHMRECPCERGVCAGLCASKVRYA